MSTIIIGGGIIGLSTAYYLSQSLEADSDEIHVVDSAPSLLMSSSGYAGGFLAKDWFSPQVASLGSLSFRLHRELADKHDGHRKWGYAESTAYSLAVDNIGVGKLRKVRQRKRQEKDANGDEWLAVGTSRADVAQGQPVPNKTDKDVNGEGRDEMLNEDGTPAWITRQEGGTLETISSEDGCAQVEPRELCEWLIEQCKARGVKFHLGRQPSELSRDDAGKVDGVKALHKRTAEQSVIHGKKIVITAGPWTPVVFKTLFPNSRTRVGISPLAGYSIVVRSPRYSRPIVDPARHGKGDSGVTGMCHSVFCGAGPQWSFAPEAIARMTRDGRPEVFVAGLNDSSLALPEDVTCVEGLMDKAKMKTLRQTTVLLTGLSKEGDDLVDDDLEIVREGLCLRPVSNTNRPIVSKVREDQLGKPAGWEPDNAVYVAAGHGPWGITLGPGTGLVVAEMLQGRGTSAEISGLRLR